MECGLRLPTSQKPFSVFEPWSKTGHIVVFGDGENGTEHYIMNRATGEYNAVRDDGLNYLMRLCVVPPSAKQPFAGQVAAR